MTETRVCAAETFAPGWYVVKGVSHHFRAPGESLCRNARWTPRCERRRMTDSRKGQTARLVPAAAHCGWCQDAHAALWAEGKL